MDEDGTARQALRNVAKKKATKSIGKACCAHEDEVKRLRRDYFVSCAAYRPNFLPQKSLRPRTESARTSGVAFRGGRNRVAFRQQRNPSSVIA
jgi:hypothetical protein